MTALDRRKSLEVPLGPLDPPPAYLARISDTVMRPGRDRVFARDLMASLYSHGIAARPTLAEVEAERTRRGFRPGLSLRP